MEWNLQQCCTKISEETAPVSDFRAGAEYRTAMAEVLISKITDRFA
jgi:xanthine dehydrogenase iron-sulfur cluster and FAD-binding subunit A